MDLQATDRSLTIRLTSDQVRRLRDTLALARPAEIPSPSAMIQRYPNLYVVAHLPNGAVTLVLNNEAYLAESHPGRPSYDTWTMPPGLWAEVAGWLPPETSKPGELAYLLRAERLIEQYPTGPISYEANRAALIARLLQAGIPIAQSAGEPQFTHTYVVESQAYPVEVGGDWFTYAGQRYHLPEAALYLNANLHAN